MNIIADRFKVAGRAAVNGKGFVASSKQVAHEVMLAVEAGRISAHEPLHTASQVGARSFNDQGGMIGHEAKAMELPIGLGAGLRKGGHE
jgi:hypothetical protein